MTKIGYLGPKGTFTKLAVDTTFNGEDKLGYTTIPECINAVANDEIDIAVVPVENTIEGTVQITVDYLLHEVNVPIMGEIVVPIQQHLLVSPDFKGTLADIEEVHSHSHAIAQCHKFIHNNLYDAKVEYSTSTGSAAEMVGEKGGAIAAIGNALAAEEYGLEIYEKNIHDYKNNHTRFLILTKDTQSLKVHHPVQLTKTTLKITLPSDRPGGLHQILSAFAWRKMNLSKIESRPTKTGLGSYFFIVDVNGEHDQVLFDGVQGELEALGCSLQFLGTYPVYHMIV